MRKTSCALAVVLCWAAVSSAGEIKGEVKAVSPDDSTITVAVGGKEMTYFVAVIADINVGEAKELKDIKPGTKVVLTTMAGNVNGKDQTVVRAIMSAK